MVNKCKFFQTLLIFFKKLLKVTTTWMHTVYVICRDHGSDCICSIVAPLLSKRGVKGNI